jgi:hypothetical protein
LIKFALDTKQRTTVKATLALLSPLYDNLNNLKARNNDHINLCETLIELLKFKSPPIQLAGPDVSFAEFAAFLRDQRDILIESKAITRSRSFRMSWFFETLAAARDDPAAFKQMSKPELIEEFGLLLFTPQFVRSHGTTKGKPLLSDDQIDLVNSWRAANSVASSCEIECECKGINKNSTHVPDFVVNDVDGLPAFIVLVNEHNADRDPTHRRSRHFLRQAVELRFAMRKSSRAIYAVESIGLGCSLVAASKFEPNDELFIIKLRAIDYEHCSVFEAIDYLAVLARMDKHLQLPASSPHGTQLVHA